MAATNKLNNQLVKDTRKSSIASSNSIAQSGMYVRGDHDGRDDNPPPPPKNDISGGSGGGYSGGINTQAYTDAIKAQYDAYQAQLADARAQQQAAADAAYSANKSNLQSAYKTKTQALKNNLNNTLGSLLDSYNNSQNQINDDASKALQEAYVNRMLAQRNLTQNMAAQGLSGGATESTLASLLNNYGNARNNIETTQNTNLANLENTYNTNVANANTEYNNAYANANDAYMAYLRQIESDRANALTNSYANQYSAYANLSSDYTNALMNALQAQQAYRAAAQTVTNGNAPANVESTLRSDKQRNLYKLSQSYLNNGYSAEDIIYDLKRKYNASNNDIATILNALGLEREN